jgi:bifunctional DNA-binding transcriptional regulator/antitoxin component of YhaV-PrlF toxin-antitoxin module
MDQALIDCVLLLKKFPGKGGWTYAELPGIPPDPSNPFGWRRVRGTVDGFPLKAYHLMPMGNGSLFLPVRAEIRKKIGKKEGDSVHVILYADDLPLETPDEFLLCLEEEPMAMQQFDSLPVPEREKLIQWIYTPKSQEAIDERMAKAIDRLVKERTQALHAGKKP